MSLTEVKADGGKYATLANRTKVSAGKGAGLQGFYIFLFGQFFHDEFDNVERNFEVRHARSREQID
jgi:hypothetical protein